MNRESNAETPPREDTNHHPECATTALAIVRCNGTLQVLLNISFNEKEFPSLLGAGQLQIGLRMAELALLPRNASIPIRTIPFRSELTTFSTCEWTQIHTTVKDRSTNVKLSASIDAMAGGANSSRTTGSSEKTETHTHGSYDRLHVNAKGPDERPKLVFDAPPASGPSQLKGYLEDEHIGDMQIADKTLSATLAYRLQARSKWLVILQKHGFSEYTPEKLSVISMILKKHFFPKEDGYFILCEGETSDARRI